MTALAQERMTDAAGTAGHPSRGTYGIKANTRVFKGAIVCLDSAGRAMPGDTIANGALFAVGKSSTTIDNRTGSTLGGAADAADVEVEFGVFGFENGDSIAASDVGAIAYVVDDQTVAKSSSTGARCIAGVITEVRGTQVFVAMGPHVYASLV